MASFIVVLRAAVNAHLAGMHWNDGGTAIVFHKVA